MEVTGDVSITYVPTTTTWPIFPAHVCRPRCPYCGEPLHAQPWPPPMPIWLIPPTYTVTC